MAALIPNSPSHLTPTAGACSRPQWPDCTWNVEHRMTACSSDVAPRAPAHMAAAHPTQPERIEMGTPFPWLPMVTIALCLVTVAYALCSLFPYAGYMVRQLGVTDDKDEAGFYAGYLSSAFMIGQFGGSYFWGRFADTYGRLPVMYMGLCSVVFLSVAFGMSTTFAWAVTCRFLLGALNGLVATAKTMISEICGSEHEVVGMSFVTGCWSVGLVVGSGLGGLLAEPAKHYPTMFLESGLLGRFPYLFPNILGGGLALISLPMVFFFIEETMEAHKSSDSFKSILPLEAEFHSQEAAADERGGVGTTNLHKCYDPQLAIGGGVRATAGSGGKHGCLIVGDKGSVQARLDDRLPLVEQHPSSPTEARELEGGALLNVHGGARGNAQSGGDRIEEGEAVDPGGGEGQRQRRRIAFLRECLLPMKLLEQKRVRTVVFVYVLFSFLIVGFEEAYPLWTISSVATGGLDWTTLDVGQVLAACGGGMLIFQLLVYPRIVQRAGTTTSQRWSCCIAIPIFLAYPFLSRLRDSEGVLKAASLVLLFVTNVAGNAMFINLSLAINNAVDTSERGTLNGLSMMLGSLASGAGPIVFSSIFAWSIYRRRPFPLDRNLVFCLFSLGMFIVTVTSWNVDTSSVASRSKQLSPLPAVMLEETAGEVAEKGLRSGT